MRERTRCLIFKEVSGELGDCFVLFIPFHGYKQKLLAVGRKEDILSRGDNAEQTAEQEPFCSLGEIRNSTSLLDNMSV